MNHRQSKSALALLAALLLGFGLTGCSSHEGHDSNDAKEMHEGDEGKEAHEGNEEHEEGEEASKTTAALAKLPQAAQDSIKKIVGPHKLSAVDTETENGKTVYEAEYKIHKADYSVSVDDAGNILELEIDVDPSIIPTAVTDAAVKAHPDSRLGEMSITEASGKLYYELDIKAADKKYEMQINPDGSVISDAIDAD